MHTPTPPAPGDLVCGDTQAPTPTSRPLFPPKDADDETRRRWLASSPWPEVVFASAV